MALDPDKASKLKAELRDAIRDAPELRDTLRLALHAVALTAAECTDVGYFDPAKFARLLTELV